MKKYMLILVEDSNIYAAFSPEDMQNEIKLHMEWIEELGEHYDSGEPLEPAAKTINGKDNIVTDGPYIESKELVSGFYLLNAKNLDHATELAKNCPVLRLGGKVEVRQVMEFDA